MSSFKIYVLLLFGITVGLYMVGYTSPFLNIASGSILETDVATALLQAFFEVFTNPIFLSLLGVSAIASFVASGGNFSVTYLIPMLLLQAMLNFFILPTSFILAMEIDPMMKLIIGGFLNIFLAMAMIEFIRGV